MKTLEKMVRESVLLSEASTDIFDLTEEFIGVCELKLSPNTIPTRRTHLMQFAAFCKRFGFTDVRVITNQMITVYLGNYTKDHRQSTANTSLRVLKAFFTWIYAFKEINTRVIPVDLKVTGTRNDLPKAIDWRIITMVINACKNEQDAIMIRVAVETGVRIAELIAITIGDINGRSIRIHGKGSVDRTVMMTHGLESDLIAFVSKSNLQPSDHLFNNDYCNAHGPMNAKTARIHIQRQFIDIAGIHIVPHQLRHSFAIYLLTHGCNIVTIQKLLGHADINTTRIYLRLTDKYVENDYDKAFESASNVLT